MKRVLPLLSVAVLAFAVVVGCDGNNSYPYDEVDESCSKTSRTTGKKVDCDTNDDDKDDAAKRVVPPDSAIVTLASGQDVACMTVDVDTAYWVRRDGTIAALPTTDVPSTGRATIADSPIRAEIGSGPCALVRDGSYLWVTAFKDGLVRRLTIRKNADRTVSFGDGTLTFSGFGTPSSLAVDATSVYVAEYDGGTIRRFPKPPEDAIVDAGADADAASPVPESDAGAAPETLATSGTKAGHLVVDDASVYWLSYASTDGETGVRRVAKTGGTVTTLALAGKDLKRKGLQRVGGSLYFFDASSRVFTVSTTGGLATPVRDTGAMAFASEGTSLFLASSNQIVEIGPEYNGTSFTYSSITEPIATVLLAQPGRLVWAFNGEIATRVVRR